MLLTLFLAIVFCAAITLMLLSAVSKQLIPNGTIIIANTVHSLGGVLSCK